jgi:hypothetical protein
MLVVKALTAPDTQSVHMGDTHGTKRLLCAELRA